MKKQGGIIGASGLAKTRDSGIKFSKPSPRSLLKAIKSSMETTNDVQILILASARIVCNIVYVQVRGRIHRELRCEN